jgi:hypothetical protein
VIDNLIASWEQVLGCVCVGFTLMLAKQSLDEAHYKLSGAAAKLASITFGRLSALLLIDKSWFLTKGKDLLLCSSYFPLGVSQLPGHNNH